MYTLVAKDWKELSKAASQERDPKKFMDLIEQLNQALEEAEEKSQSSRFFKELDN